MKLAFTHVLGVLLTLPLAVFGSVSMAQAGSNAVFSTKTCADGVAKTVSFDRTAGGQMMRSIGRSMLKDTNA